LSFAFCESDTILPRFVCGTATKKNNVIHSNSPFSEGKQMGSHFLKPTTAAEATGVFCYHEELFQLYMKIYYSTLGTSLNLVSALFVRLET
jgi:hypothetical protein